MSTEKIILCGFADEADPMLDGQIEALKGNGISLLEIRGVDGKNIVDVTREEAKAIRAKLDANGISVWSLGSPIGKININDDFDAAIYLLINHSTSGRYSFLDREYHNYLDRYYHKYYNDLNGLFKELNMTMKPPTLDYYEEVSHVLRKVR